MHNIDTEYAKRAATVKTASDPKKAFDELCGWKKKMRDTKGWIPSKKSLAIGSELWDWNLETYPLPDYEPVKEEV
jgi:hypothetical protein